MCTKLLVHVQKKNNCFYDLNTFFNIIFHCAIYLLIKNHGLPILIKNNFYKICITFNWKFSKRKNRKIVFQKSSLFMVFKYTIRIT